MKPLHLAKVSLVALIGLYALLVRYNNIVGGAGYSAASQQHSAKANVSSLIADGRSSTEPV